MEIYLVFTDTKTWLSRMIKVYTRHAYSHVSLSFDWKLTEMYSFGRKDIENVFSGGFVKEDIRNRLFRQAECAVYKCKVSAESFGRMREYVLEIERQQEQFKYSVEGIIGVMLNRASDQEYKFFCSQFVASVLAKSDIRVPAKPVSLVRPSDLEMLEQLEPVYRGALIDYPYSVNGPEEFFSMLGVL